MTVLTFKIPVKPEGLLSEVEGRFSVQTEHDAGSMPRAQLQKMLAEARDRVEDEPLAICENEVFDMLFACATSFRSLAVAQQQQASGVITLGMSGVASVVQALFGGASGARESLVLCREAVKMYVFLARWMLQGGEEASSSHKRKQSAASKKKKQSGWTWVREKEAVLMCVASILECDLCRLWGLPTPDSDFVGLVVHMVKSLLESPHTMRHKTLRATCLMLITSIVHRYKQCELVSAMVSDLLTHHTHTPAPMVALCVGIASEPSGHQLVAEIFR
jgi:non-SMC mitotic condensation complex subunit 1, N-term